MISVLQVRNLAWGGWLLCSGSHKAKVQASVGWALEARRKNPFPRPYKLLAEFSSVQLWDQDYQPELVLSF